MEDHDITIVLQELQTLREEIARIGQFVSTLQKDYSVLEEKIELSTNDVGERAEQSHLDIKLVTM